LAPSRRDRSRSKLSRPPASRTFATASRCERF
jgi:hypothetical protein